MIWSAQTIQERCAPGDFKPAWKELVIRPFYAEKSVCAGMSFGLTAAGYDIRLGSPSHMTGGIRLGASDFTLAHSLEYVRIPEDALAIVHDKSSWARKGLSLFNTVLEPGWFGHITLELANHNSETLYISYGSPIAQIVFHQLDSRTSLPYSGKYQNQPNYPVRSLREGESI